MRLTTRERSFTVLGMENETITGGAKRGRGKTREMVLRWAQRGLNGAEIGRKVGISRQQANTYLRELRASGDLPEPKGNGLA